MKIYKLNSFTTFFFIVMFIGLVVFIPIFVIQIVWNGTVGETYTHMTIDFWQSLILWLIALVILNILGFFKFEFAVESNDTSEKTMIKKKIQEMKSKTEEGRENEKSPKNNQETSKKD